MGEMADYAIESAFEAMLDDPWEHFESDASVQRASNARPEFFSDLPVGPGQCPKCGANTVIRKGKHGVFRGCSRFPDCKGSRNV